MHLTPSLSEFCVEFFTENDSVVRIFIQPQKDSKIAYLISVNLNLDIGLVEI